MKSISGPADYKLVEYDDLRPGAKIGVFGPTGLISGPYTVNRVEKAEIFVEHRGNNRAQFDLHVWGIPGPYIGSPQTRDNAGRQLRLISPAPDTQAFVPRLATIDDIVKGAVVQRSVISEPKQPGWQAVLLESYFDTTKQWIPKVQTDKGPLYLRDYGIIPPGYEYNAPVPYYSLWLVKPGEEEAPPGPKEREREPEITGQQTRVIDDLGVIQHISKPQPQPLEKEKPMNKYDVADHINDLITLARGDSEDNIPNFSAAPSAVQQALKRKLAEAAEKAAEASADVIMAIIDAAKHDEVYRSEKVRAHKRDIQLHKEAGDARNRAYAYGMATDNWIPLAHLLGIAGYVSDIKLCKVPEDWVAPSTTK